MEVIMNSKGMSTVELMVSFVIISLVSIGLFSAVIDLLDKIDFYQEQARITILQGNIINSMQKDLKHRKLYGYKTCGTDCYDITYQDLNVRRFKVDTTNNTIQYGSITEKVPEGFAINGSIIFTSTKIDTTVGKNDSILKVYIPISNDTLDINGDINVIHQYDSRDTGTLPPYI
jgi:Tfp pilus assembly protein PilW